MIGYWRDNFYDFFHFFIFSNGKNQKELFIFYFFKVGNRGIYLGKIVSSVKNNDRIFLDNFKSAW